MQSKKLKNSLSVILVLIVFFTQIGIFKYYHFCGDELASQSFFISDNDCGCDPNEEQGCCENHVKVIQFKNEGISFNSGTQLKAHSNDLFFLSNLNFHEEVKYTQPALHICKTKLLKAKIPPPEILITIRCLLI